MILKLIIILKNNKDSDLLKHRKCTGSNHPQIIVVTRNFNFNFKFAAVSEGQILMTHKIRLILLLSFHKKLS
jgi:hypothetical protein